MICLLGFLEFSFIYYLLNSVYKEAPILTLFFSLCLNGSLILVSMLPRYYFFQDSNEICKIALEVPVQIAQISGGAIFVTLAFIAFQQFLTKHCEK